MTDTVPETHHSSLSALTRKIGPLPGYAWVVIVVAIYYLYRKFYGGGGTATNTPVGTSDATPGSTGYSTSPVDYGGGAGYASGGMLTSPGSGVSAAQDNASWGKQAAGALIASGANPGLVNNAINDYLNGNPLSAQEQQIINQALSQFGEPPNGVLPVLAVTTPTGGPGGAGGGTGGSAGAGGGTGGSGSSGSSGSGSTRTGTTASQTSHYVIEHVVGTNDYYDVTDRNTVHKLTAAQLAADRSAGATMITVAHAPTPVGHTPTPVSHAPAPVQPKPKPKPKPPAARSYTVRSGDSLSSIAAHYYGNSSAWEKIYNANRSKIGSNPNLIHKGTVLEIPS